MHTYNLRPRLYPIRYFPVRARAGDDDGARLVWLFCLFAAYFMLLMLFEFRKANDGSA